MQVLGTKLHLPCSKMHVYYSKIDSLNAFPPISYYLLTSTGSRNMLSNVALSMQCSYFIASNKPLASIHSVLITFLNKKVKEVMNVILVVAIRPCFSLEKE